MYRPSEGQPALMPFSRNDIWVLREVKVIKMIPTTVEIKLLKAESIGYYGIILITAVNIALIKQYNAAILYYDL